MSHQRFTRREAIANFGGLGAGVRLKQRQETSESKPPRLTPLDELVNVSEFEDMAKLKLEPKLSALLAEGDRSAFDRTTFRPRMLVKSTGVLDLSVELLGERMFAPLMVGPIDQQRQFHQDGELATVRGAEAAKSAVVISSRSSVPLGQIAAQAKTTLWYQVYQEDDTSAVREQIKQSVAAGYKAVCITVGPHGPDRSTKAVGGGRPDWRKIDTIRQGSRVPVLLKGVMTTEDAKAASERGLGGIVVSNGGAQSGEAAPIEALAPIVDVVAGKIPILVDGGFRRGTDVVKALAFGARAVMLGRPPMWALAAYGAPGVQSLLEIVQTEVGRTMVNMSKPTIKMLDRTLIKVHSRPR